MISPETVIFAIQAGVKLGRKLHDVLVDETRERPLFLPLGHVDDAELDDAQLFFQEPKHKGLVAEGAPYFGLSGNDLIVAYRTVTQLEEQVGGGSREETTVEVLQNLHKFEQVKEGHGANPAVQRILGTIVEIGIEYYSANPPALLKDSRANKIVAAFIRGLDDVHFAEGEGEEILRGVIGHTLQTALVVLDGDASIISNDDRTRVLIGGITTAFKEEIEQAGNIDMLISRQDLFKRITASILRGGAAAVADNVNLFLDTPTDGRDGKIVLRAAVLELLDGIRDNENLFTPDTLEKVVGSALKTVADNPGLVSGDKFLKELVGRTLTALTDGKEKGLFTPASVALILREALETVGDNIEMLIDTSHPQRQLAADAIVAMSHGLTVGLHDGKGIKTLLSTARLVEMSKIVFNEVAKNPEKLLGAAGTDTRKTALAQIIGSVAAAVAQDPTRVANGRTFLDLVETALRTAVRNADKLLNLDTENPKDNLLYTLLRELGDAVSNRDKPRQLVDRDVFVDIARRVLPIASSNLDIFLAGRSQPLKIVIETTLELANNALKNRINGENLPLVIEGLLRRVLVEKAEERLDPTDGSAAEAAAKEILRAAA